MKSINQIFPIAWLIALLLAAPGLQASSHREAPLIANDPLADNTDVYAFRSPDDPNSVTLIANYIPLQLPQGGPNYYQFGENVRYELHVDNDVTTTGDDIIYRFTFTKTNEDPTTFFNIRLGLQNLKTTYTLERSTDGGASFHTIISQGIVPPPNIGPRSIEGPVGLDSDYETLMTNAITTASSGEKVYCGPADDPFFVDLGGIFDLGDAPRQNGMPKDGVSCLNVSTIAIQIPISTLQKDGKDVSMAANILDGDFVVGVWASASRPQMRTLGASMDMYSGPWVQVSRLGMPLTNEAVIPIGAKDEWNARTPYNENPAHFEYFYNPELALYMDDSLFGGAVPAFAPLRIQRNSLGSFDFGNGQDGLFPLKGNPALAGTALDDAVFGTLLLPGAGKPRSVDLWPAFHTGVPNLEPYQLATGKGGNPLATGKPFVNNFLPNGGDMLRLNMATPATDRNSASFSSLGLIQAAVLGLTDTTYTNSGTALQFIPNMDGFPNGRRLEDDVTRIELQAVSGVVLAAIGLWYDDFDGTTPVTQDLIDVLTFTTGVESNDTTFRSSFPYVQLPWSGAGKCSGLPVFYQQPTVLAGTEFICDAGMVSTENGQTQDTICLNSMDLSLSVTNTSSTGASYAYVITDGMDQILGVSMIDSLYFGGATPGNCRVYGVSYTGTLSAMTGTDISTVSADGCIELSWNYVTVVRGDENDAFCQEAPVLALSFKNSENGGGFVMNRTIKPQVRIEHISGASVELADLTVRYWFTKDNPGPLTVNCQDSDAGCASVDAQLFSMMPAASGADTYLEVGFTNGSISLGEQVNTKIRIGRGDNLNFDESDDYSFIGQATDHVNNPNIALYWNGILIAGTEPMGGNGNSARRIETVNLPALEADVYPNPFQQSFLIEMAENPEEQVEVRMLGVLGQEVFRKTTSAATVKIEGRDLPAGMYFVEVRQGETRRVYRVVKQ